MKRSIIIALLLIAGGLAGLAGCDRADEPYPGPGPIESFRAHPVVVMQDAITETADGTAILMHDAESAVIQVQGITTATVTFEATVDGSNWKAVAMSDLNSTTRARATTATADGLYLLDPAGSLSELRARISVYTAGTITVKGRAH